MVTNETHKEPCSECGYYEDNVAIHYEDCSLLQQDNEHYNQTSIIKEVILNEMELWTITLNDEQVEELAKNITRKLTKINNYENKN